MTEWEEIYREHWGSVVARLAGRFGPRRLDEIEAAVQDAFLSAHSAWQLETPSTPLAWLITAASNRMLDTVRKERGHQAKAAEIGRHLGEEPGQDREPRLAAEVNDDLLRMLFVCCHSSLADDARVPLTLKSLCGFEIPELAKIFLVSEDAIGKRLVRARKTLREGAVAFELPPDTENGDRLSAVLKVLYLIYGEGYSGHSGTQQIRANLCEEAIRLTSELSQHPGLALPRTWALLAMFLLSSARLPARIDATGELVDLEHQDRRLWDGERIRAGFAFLQRSAHGAELSGYHLEAMIAACHARAPSHEKTDWAQIRTLYLQLHDLVPSPVVLLQAAIALGYADGPRAALKEMDSLAGDKFMQRFYLYYAAIGEFSARAGEPERAKRAMERALDLTDMPAEKSALRKKMSELA